MTPRNTIELADFPGMMSNVDPRDIPPGAADEQVNAASVVAGEMLIRHGLREISFEAN